MADFQLQEKLLDKYVHMLVWKARGWNRWFTKEELVSFALESIFKAEKKYDPARGHVWGEYSGLERYLWHCGAWYRMREILRTNQRQIMRLSNAKKNAKEKLYMYPPIEVDESTIWDVSEFLSTLESEKLRGILQRRISGTTNVKMAKEMNISPQAISLQIKKAKKKMVDWAKKEGIHLTQQQMGLNRKKRKTTCVESCLAV